MKLYQRMAHAAMLKDHTALRALLDELPHGSGIDGDWKVDEDQCSQDKLVFFNEYHHMNDAGFYDGWTDFEVVVTPTLWTNFKLRVVGRFPASYLDTRDYLYELIEEALSRDAVK